VALRLFYGTLTVSASSAKPGERGTHVENARTAPRYRLYSLDGFPVLVDTGDGAEIDVQIWDVPECHWQTIVDSEPPEMSAAAVELDDGREVDTLVGTRSWVESRGAVDVTAHRSWAEYLRASA
jgi:allophanate hydrolase